MACTRDRENDEVCEESPIETEIESLEAIYINELTYSRKSDGTVNTIELLLHPATGDDVTKQFVCMTLIFTPSPKYPDEIPTIEIKNPRGLGEEEIASLVEDMIAKAHECVGEVMLFTLIEMAKDSLTDGNIPHCPCVVCLEHFHEDDLFHRTSCYHYFHNRCLNRYLEHRRKQIEEEEREEASERRHIEFSEEEKVKIIGCPVCRAPLGEGSLSVTSEILDCMGQQEVEETPFVLPPEMKEQQAKMADLFAQQKAKGGIIDLEQEKNKYLVNEENRWSLPSMTTAEASLGSPAGRAESETQLHQRSQNGIHSRGGRKDGRRSAQGRHHPGEKDYNSHNRHREGGKGHRLRYHNPHHHQQQQQHGHGRGTPWRGGSGNRGNRDGAEKSQTAQGLERPVMKSSKRDEKDGFLSRTVEGENTANTDKRRKEDDNVMKSGEDTQLPMRISQSVEEKKERSEPNSRYNEENENIHFPRGQVRETNQNVRKVFHERQRGGGRFSADANQTQHQKNYCSEHRDMDADHPRLRREYENTRRYEAEIENKGPQMRGPRKDGRRGRGRGRFSDFDDMYFNSKREDDEVSAGGENCDRQSKSKKDPTLRERASGCRESENRDQRRNNEYDEDEDRNEQSHRRVAGSNRGPRHQRRGGAEMKYKRNEGVQGSQTRGCDIQHQMQERLHEDQRISIQNKTATSRKVGRYDENVDNSLDEKIQVEFEVNRRWRRLTYGYGESSKHTGGQATENNKNNYRPHCNINNDKEKSLETKQKSGISGGCSLTPDSDTSHLNRIYVGYDEVGEEEEDWDEERFAYAYERRHIKLEDLGKYDKFRRKDYQLRGKKVEERDQRQRLLDEEDRRLRREEADAERREQSSSDSKPTKSVLELFQEKQEAKKREADALRHEQQQQQQQQAQISKKTESETKPDAGRHRKNSISSQAFVSTSPSSSSQDYQSQSSTEEPAQEDLQNCHDPHAMNSVVKPPEPGRDLGNEKSTLVAQISGEIQWVGVKKQPDPGDAHSGSLKEQDPDADGEGREDPYLDALAEREERRRVESRKKKAKSYRPNVESDEPVLETQAPDVPALPIVSDRSETRPDGTKTTESLSDSSQTREQSQHMNSTVAKQKPLTKAPPLKLSTRNKQSTNSHAAKELCAKLANSGSSDLTKDELANLKALYGTEAVLEYKEVKNGTSTPNSLMPEASNKNKMFPKSAANMRKNQQDGILAQDLKPASLPQAVNSTDNQNREDLKTKVVPQSKVKPMKKAPPLNLKQVSVKPSPCDKIESNAIIQDANNLKNGGGQDMTKVMKYLGIGLNDDFFTVDSTKS
ncbi:E3 ubiquitin-protein ligase rnf25-like [Plakobranchus ocellatus]|uniref:E3 ubiquitin-protein ligase rnf25-like n=1 Tax=Plakobranchus ocellatus TaxID=259542 RepID=A0AAV4CQE1_9GAST|nr:E3 ubiquitin-protein ligase rnf25-like [Plakobranchus ocellatus]